MPRGDDPHWTGPHDEAVDGAVAAEPRGGGLLGSETFTISAVFLLTVTLFSSQIVQLFGTATQLGDQPVQHEQVAQLSNQALVGGGLALLTVLFAALALAPADMGTRGWARWSAMATVIVGLLFVIVAVLTYIMIPAGTDPQMPEMPAIPQ